MTGGGDRARGGGCGARANRRDRARRGGKTCGVGAVRACGSSAHAGEGNRGREKAVAELPRPKMAAVGCIRTGKKGRREKVVGSGGERGRRGGNGPSGPSAGGEREGVRWAEWVSAQESLEI